MPGNVSGWPQYLGRGLSILVDCLNPEVIVLGGIFGRCHDLLVPPMEAVLKDEALERALSVCRIVPAQLGEAIGRLCGHSGLGYKRCVSSADPLE